MAKGREVIKWLKTFIGVRIEDDMPLTIPPKSIMERLENLLPDVDSIRNSYKVDTSIAEAAREAMLAVERLLKETERALAKAMSSQQTAIKAQDLLSDQQEVTGAIIEFQHYKKLDAETIIINLREWLLGDDLTISWMLENVLIPAFTLAFARQTESRQRKLFNSLRVAVNVLQKLDGILQEPDA